MSPLDTLTMPPPAPPSLPLLSDKLAAFLSRVILDTEPPPAPPAPPKERDTDNGGADTVPRLSAARRRALLFAREDLVVCLARCCPRCHLHVSVHPTRPHAWLCVTCMLELGETAWQDADGEDDEGGPVTLVNGELRAGNGQPLRWAAVLPPALISAPGYDGTPVPYDLLAGPARPTAHQGRALDHHDKDGHDA